MLMYYYSKGLNPTVVGDMAHFLLAKQENS